ncbi:MAG: hypothetical protein MJ178_00020 [Treponemataceae bacterium]|nr:hypothetical protein [Treponemataceae bacterium]
MVVPVNKKVVLFLVLLPLCAFLSAQSADNLWFNQVRDFSNVNPRVVQFEKQFLTGDLQQKAAVLEASTWLHEEAAPLYTDALNFVYEYADLLKNEPGMEALTASAISHAPYAMGDVSVQLLSIFIRWDNRNIHQAVLNVFPDLGFYGYESASVFNGFALSLLKEDRENWDLEQMLATLQALQVIDDASSFDIFFAYYALPEDDDTFVLRECSRRALLAARDEHLSWFSSMLDNGSSQYQKSALQFILENAEFSDFFRAEMAEKALQNAIFTAEETDVFCDDDVALQLMALQELRRLSWTRASSLVQRLFPIAVGEFEDGLISDEEFIGVISGVQELASLRAGVLLSDFLKTLNSRAERSDFCSESLVLAVIRSLGALGDKIAFDPLLYVSYLPYPETVIEASREALARLKW